MKSSARQLISRVAPLDFCKQRKKDRLKGNFKTPLTNLKNSPIKLRNNARISPVSTMKLSSFSFNETISIFPCYFKNRYEIMRKLFPFLLKVVFPHSISLLIIYIIQVIQNYINDDCFIGEKCQCESIMIKLYAYIRACLIVHFDEAFLIISSIYMFVNQRRLKKLFIINIAFLLIISGSVYITMINSIKENLNYMILYTIGILTSLPSLLVFIIYFSYKQKEKKKIINKFGTPIFIIIFYYFHQMVINYYFFREVLQPCFENLFEKNIAKQVLNLAYLISLIIYRLCLDLLLLRCYTLVLNDRFKCFNSLILLIKYFYLEFSFSDSLYIMRVDNEKTIIWLNIIYYYYIQIKSFTSFDCCRSIYQKLSNLIFKTDLDLNKKINVISKFEKLCSGITFESQIILFVRLGYLFFSKKWIHVYIPEYTKDCLFNSYENDKFELFLYFFLIGSNLIIIFTAIIYGYLKKKEVFFLVFDKKINIITRVYFIILSHTTADYFIQFYEKIMF